MLCGCVGEKNLSDCQKAIKKAQTDGADLIELRIDYLDKKDDLKKIILGSPLPVIATHRGENQKLLLKAIKSGAKYIDMDLDEIDKDVLRFAKKKGSKVILSYHNFASTPPLSKLQKTSKILQQKGADILKIITTPRSLIDNQTILSLYQKTSLPLIAFGMGKIGQGTRTDCLAYGSPWTYCSIRDKGTAPGQISLKTAKRTKIYCLIGNPVKHSMSPAMHNANFRSLNIKAKYTAVPVVDLKKYLKNFTARKISGANITMPHKIEVMKYLDEIDPLAKKIGAINTVQNKNKKLIGYNTDGQGALLAIKEKIKNIKNKKISILGSGGAARAIYFTLKQEKADPLIIAKDKKQAATIRKFVTLNNRNLKTELEKTDILINCTPVGMDKEESLVPQKYLKKHLVVFDIVYNPLKTKLIKDAEAVGCQTILGYKMLVHQGARSFDLWTGLKPNLPIMTNIVRNGLSPNIALIGFMGSGKTTVGRILAERLNRKFIDLDDEIEKKTETTISKIFADYGERHFRKLETSSLRKVLSGENLIISCGGGIILKEQNRKLLKSCLVILLEAKPETIIQRLENDSNRPLLNASNREKIKLL